MSQSSGEKTEKPTAKRIREARKKGQVAKSRDLSSAVILLSLLFVLWVSSGTIIQTVQLLFQNLIKEAFLQKHGVSGISIVSNAFEGVFSTGVIVIIPVLAVAFFTALLSNYLQVGSLFSTETIKFNFSKLNLAANFNQKFFKSRSYLEFIKSFLKMFIVVSLGIDFLWSSKKIIVNTLLNSNFQTYWAVIGRLLFELSLRVCLVFLIMGVLDFLLQKYLLIRELMMTKQEVKQDYKDSQGNPLIKSKRRSIHKEILSQDMSSSVRNSTVIITNPTHLSVALSYSPEKEAPIVAAKGADYIALQIRLKAQEYSIPIKEDILLARALYEIEIDERISEELYESVALVLNWVYKLQNKKKGRGI